MLNPLEMVVDLKALLVRKVLREQMAKMELLVHKDLREPMVLRVHKDLQAQEVVLTVGIQMVMAFRMPMKM
jgi:hypothetical protein